MDLISLINKKLVLERLVIGLQEPVLVKGIGQITAKVDSGNGGLNVIHGDNFVLQGNQLMFDTKIDNGEKRKVSKEVVGYIDVNIGGGNIQHRPIVELDIKFADTDYKKIKFSVTDRSSNDTLILISKAFVQDELNALIDVSGINLTQDGTVEAEIVSEALNDGKGIVGDGSNSGVNKKDVNAGKGVIAKTGDFLKKVGNSFDNASKVMDTVRTGKGSLIGGLEDFFKGLPGADAIKELMASFKKDGYYKADKPKIQEEINRQIKNINSDNAEIKNLIRLIDFCGGGWDDNSTKIFQGAVPYLTLKDRFKSAAQDINESYTLITKLINEAELPAANNNIQQNQNQPAQNQPAQNQAQPVQQAPNEKTDSDKNTNRNSDAFNEASQKLKEKSEELTKKGVRLDVFITEITNIQKEFESTIKDPKELENFTKEINKIITKYAQTKVTQSQNFIIYFVDLGSKDYKKSLKNALNQNVIDAALKIFEGGDTKENNTISSTIDVIKENLAADSTVKGCLALVTGAMDSRKVELIFLESASEVKSSTDINRQLDILLNDFDKNELPGVSENIKDIDFNTDIDNLTKKLNLPSASKNSKEQNFDAKIKDLVDNAALPKITKEPQTDIDSQLDELTSKLVLPEINQEEHTDINADIEGLIKNLELPILEETDKDSSNE